MMEDEGRLTTLLFGLSADPLHQAHVDLVVEAAKRLSARGYGIGRIVIIPVYRRNPAGARRKAGPGTPFEDRFAMCQLGAQEIGRRLSQPGISVEVSRVDQKLAQGTGKPNTMVETLGALQAEAPPGMGWILLLGSDLVSGGDPELGHWHQPEKLVRLATMAIYPRPGYPSNPAFLSGLERKGACFVQVDGVAQGNINASQIRGRLRAGHDPLALSREGLLPEPVADYIRRHGLYQAGRGPAPRVKAGQVP